MTTPAIVVFEAKPREVTIVNLDAGTHMRLPVVTRGDPLELRRVRNEAGPHAIWLDNPELSDHPAVRAAFDQQAGPSDQPLCPTCAHQQTCAVPAAARLLGMGVHVGACEGYHLVDG